MPRLWFELGNCTPKRKPSDGKWAVSFRSLIFVQRVKSPTSFVELAPAATLRGIALGPRELMLKKFCATPSSCTSTFGDRPMLMPITPARVKSPVSPETGYLALCTKSIPASIRIDPGGMMSTSSVSSGRCWPQATTTTPREKANAAALRAIDLIRLIMRIRFFQRLQSSRGL